LYTLPREARRETIRPKRDEKHLSARNLQGRRIERKDETPLYNPGLKRRSVQMVYLDWNEMWMEAMNNATWMKGCKNLNAQTARKRVEQYNKDALLREIRNNQVGRLVGSGLSIG
jgi:hypothetical protein